MKMLKPSTVEAYISLAVGVITVIFPMTWYFRLLLVLVIAALVIDIIVRSTYTSSLSKAFKAILCMAVLVVLGAISWKPMYEDYRGKEFPDVALKFVDQRYPSLVIQNLSRVTAKEIKWTVVLWNTNKQASSDSVLDPLPIPVQTFDFLRPKASGGPNSLFNSFSSQIRPGDRLLGVASVICPDCVKGRTYIVSIEWGKSGWYYEMPKIEEGNIPVPPRFTKDILEKYFASLDAEAPSNKRIQIQDR